MSGFFVTEPMDFGHIDRRHPEIQELVCFNEVYDVPWRMKKYLGARQVQWTGPRWDTPATVQSWMFNIPGVAGIQTPSYVDQVVANDLATIISLPLDWHFYISLEVGIDVFGDHIAVRDAWKRYLNRLIPQAKAFRPDVEFLWSPYAWTLWSYVNSTQKTRIKTAMTQIAATGITTIDLQDGRGAQPSEPETDAVNWYNLIKACGSKVRINMEYFTQYYTPQPPEEMFRREAYYASHNVPIGNCWALPRYW